MSKNNFQAGVAAPIVIGIIILVIAAGGGLYLFRQDQEEIESNVMEKSEEAMMKDGEMIKDDSMMDKDEGAMMKDGSYEAYGPEKLALATEGKVILFFRASWCPTCRAVDADIRANLSKIPAGVTILDVDYDTATALKQKYGVTYQHTFIQVDASGNKITKWTSSPILASLLANIK